MRGRVLDGLGQGQAEEGILLDAADTSFQDLFRSCVTRGTRVQEVDPRCDRGSNPLRNPGDLEVDPAALMNLLCTSLSRWNHAMLHSERTRASTGHLLLSHGLKFHHHHLLFVGYIWLSTLHMQSALMTPKIYIHPHPTHYYYWPDGDTKTQRISLSSQSPALHMPKTQVF